MTPPDAVGAPHRRARRESRPLPPPVFAHIGEAAAEPPVLGEGVLRRFETAFLRWNRWIDRALPEELNPVAQLGAVANTALLIALVTGILLLFWYVPSVHKAYESIMRIESAPYFAGLIRSLHRYSSDACMLFVALHGLQTLLARKVGGARKLAWISGILLVGFVWLDGWTGYWLVWDERARQVALGSAKLLDALPIFPDPLERTFLTDGSLNSLFFFVVFFIHMLIPLALAVGLWVHVMRLNRAKILTGRLLTLAIVGALFVVSLIFPAAAAEPAKMAIYPEAGSADWFYLLPLFLTDRLQGGVLWLIALVPMLGLISAAWWLPRRKSAKAVVERDRCNGCTQCYHDCPYNAIELIPRPDGGGKNPVWALVDPARCVGCGVCVGACDSSAIDIARPPVPDVRTWLNRQVDHGGQGKHVAFVCGNSAAADLHLDHLGETAALPGYRVVPVPCAGWVHMLMVERAIRNGAEGVLIVGCGPDAACRKGEQWTLERMAGTREPELRSDQVPADRVRFVQSSRTALPLLQREAHAFRMRRAPVREAARPVRRAAVAVVLAVGLSIAVLFGSDLFYRPPALQGSELVVSFKHAGKLVTQATASEDENLLPHMRGATTQRPVRAPVRLRILVDGSVLHDASYKPSGLFSDGESVAIARVPVEPGSRRIQLQVGSGSEPETWEYVDEQTVEFEDGVRRVVLFDAIERFVWH